MTKLLKLLPFIFLLLLLVNCKPPRHREKIEKFLVTKVVDGDTFWISSGQGKALKIRLIGIDAPESRISGKKEIGYFGKEAKEFLTTLILNKFVRLEYDVDKYDRYGRTLAYVYLEDGTFLNQYLIEKGYAVLMTYPPNVKYVDLFIKLQEEARNNKKGLWAIDIR